MKWKTLESKKIFASGPIQFREDRCELPDGRVMPRYFVMDFPDWVNVFPITREGKVLLIRQYRYPTGQIHIELPGGASEPETDSDMAAGAQRELLEETGYQPQELISLGSHYPNPALQSNRMHTFLALGCEKVADQNLDPFEDLQVYLCSMDQLLAHLRKGEVEHTVMMASVLQVLLYLKTHDLVPDFKGF